MSSEPIDIVEEDQYVQVKDPFEDEGDPEACCEKVEVTSESPPDEEECDDCDGFVDEGEISIVSDPYRYVDVSSVFDPKRFYFHDVVIVQKNVGEFCYLLDHGVWYGKESCKITMMPVMRKGEVTRHFVVSDCVVKSFCRNMFFRGCDLEGTSLEHRDGAVIAKVKGCLGRCTSHANILGNYAIPAEVLIGFSISPSVDVLHLLPSVVEPKAAVLKPSEEVKLIASGTEEIIPFEEKEEVLKLVSIEEIKGKRKRSEVGDKIEEVLTFELPLKKNLNYCRLIRNDGHHIICPDDKVFMACDAKLPPLKRSQHCVDKEWNIHNDMIKKRKKIDRKKKQYEHQWVARVIGIGRGSLGHPVWIFPPVMLVRDDDGGGGIDEREEGADGVPPVDKNQEKQDGNKKKKKKKWKHRPPFNIDHHCHHQHAVGMLPYPPPPGPNYEWDFKEKVWKKRNPIFKLDSLIVPYDKLKSLNMQ